MRWVQYEGHDIPQLCFDEIFGVFTRSSAEGLSISDATFLCDSKKLGNDVVQKLNKNGVRCVHTYDLDERESRRQKVGFYMGDARVKATTLHSFKGWETRVLILFVGRTITAQSLALLYTGLTRLKRHPEGSFLTVVSTAPEMRKFGESWPDYESIG